MVTNNIGKTKLEKIKAQRGRIKRLIVDGDGAVLEMPDNEVLFKENIEWLKNYGITCEKTRDRDGRPIMFLDISEIELTIPQDHKRALDMENLVDSSLRSQTSREEH